MDRNAYVCDSLDLRQVYKTSCHETYHLYRSSPVKVGALEEAEAEDFAEKTTRAHRDQWIGVSEYSAKNMSGSRELAKYAYRLVPEASVTASTRAVARRALDLSVELEEISEPEMFWFMPAKEPGSPIITESSRPLAGFSKRFQIFIAADMTLRETFEAVAHEVGHISGIVHEVGTLITRTQEATEEEFDRSNERYADRFGKFLTQHHFALKAPQRRTSKR